MHCATFLAIETCPAAPYYPIACAWSLPDGRIKTSLIQPDDDWPLELCYSDYLNIDTIMAQGHSIKDVIMEMNHDLEGHRVLCHGDLPPDSSFEHIAEALDMFPDFEWSASSRELAETLGDDWRKELDDIAFTWELNLCQAEDQIQAMMRQWAQYNSLHMYIPE